jgi:hypothetical protein
MGLQALYAARLLVLADKARYDAIWIAERDNPSIGSAVVELSSIVEEISKKSVLHPLQLNRLLSSEAEARGFGLAITQRGGIAPPWLSEVLDRASSSKSVSSFAAFASSDRWRADSFPDSEDGASDYYSQPVDSLDQLYYQAVALNPLLIAKVQSWAQYSGGCFSGSSAFVAGDGVRIENGYNDVEGNELPPGFVRWMDVKEQEQSVGGQVQWAKVKSVQRSIEKTTRSYGKVCLCYFCLYNCNAGVACAALNHVVFQK